MNVVLRPAPHIRQSHPHHNHNHPRFISHIHHIHITFHTTSTPHPHKSTTLSTLSHQIHMDLLPSYPSLYDNYSTPPAYGDSAQKGRLEQIEICCNALIGIANRYQNGDSALTDTDKNDLQRYWLEYKSQWSAEWNRQLQGQVLADRLAVDLPNIGKFVCERRRASVKEAKTFLWTVVAEAKREAERNPDMDNKSKLDDLCESVCFFVDPLHMYVSLICAFPPPT